MRFGSIKPIHSAKAHYGTLRRNMPNYHYQCEKKHQMDVNHSIHENPAMTCKKCGGAMVRVPKTIIVTFNGSGFYSKDK